MFSKAQTSFNPLSLAGFSLASSSSRSMIFIRFQKVAFQGDEGATEKQACFQILSSCARLGLAWFTCYFNNLASQLAFGGYGLSNTVPLSHIGTFA